MNKLKHYITEIRKNWKNRNWWEDRFIHYVIESYYKKKPNRGIYVMGEDWDNLIILDACRYDMFEKEIRNWEIDGRLEYRISRGTCTVEFLFENFSNGYFRDIVYVTANPFVSIYLKENFYKIIPVWDFGWNEKLNTVPPDATYDATLNTILKYNKKKKDILSTLCNLINLLLD